MNSSILELRKELEEKLKKLKGVKTSGKVTKVIGNDLVSSMDMQMSYMKANRKKDYLERLIEKIIIIRHLILL